MKQTKHGVSNNCRKKCNYFLEKLDSNFVLFDRDQMATRPVYRRKDHHATAVNDQSSIIGELMEHKVKTFLRFELKKIVFLRVKIF